MYFEVFCHLLDVCAFKIALGLHLKMKVKKETKLNHCERNKK